MALASSLTDAVRGFRAARRRERWRAFALIVPLLLFLLATFVAPIAALLWRGVESPELTRSLPRTAALLRNWNDKGLPPETLLASFAQEMRLAAEAGTLGELARRLNFYKAGYRTLLLKTARNLPAPETQPVSWAGVLRQMDPLWGTPEPWRYLKLASAPVTADYLLAALDRRFGPDGDVTTAPEEERIYVAAFLRTFQIAGIVTLACLLLGYPVAWLLANADPAHGRILMLLVIVPFWTSLLVRTTAWYVLLQPEGVVNSLLLRLGLVSQPIPLIFNRAGVLIGMTHILLPFMILANYAVMKSIPPVYIRAAKSLGAHPVTAFRRVYVPQTLPGVGAGMFLVFVLAIGYYITPALLGGGGDEMISQLIAIQTERQLNWGLAGSLAFYLLLFTLLFYFLFNRLVGLDRLKLG